MNSYTCINKLRKPNGIIYGYVIKNLGNGSTIEVTPENLKTAITKKAITVDNLTLTSDFRLVNSAESKDNTRILEDVQHDGRSKFINRITSEYSGKSIHQGKLNYSMNKLKSRRVGKLVATCLMLGISASTMTGCGVEANAIPVMEEKQPKYESLQDLIENAGTVYLDVKHLKMSTISIEIRDEDGGDEYGTLKGKVLKMPGFDALTMHDNDENTIAESKETPGLNHNTWTIENSNSGTSYKLDGKFSIIFDKYNILDQDNEVIGYVKEGAAIGGKLEAYNKDGVLIATIKRDPMRSDMYITFTEDCDLDKENLVIITASIMNNKVKENKARSSSSNSDNKNNSD